MNLNLILISILVIILTVIAIGFSTYKPEPTEGQEIIYAPHGWACFANQTLADKFLKIPGNEGFSTSVPCPKDAIINPLEDESGK